MTVDLHLALQKTWFLETGLQSLRVTASFNLVLGATKAPYYPALWSVSCNMLQSSTSLATASVGEIEESDFSVDMCGCDRDSEGKNNPPCN